eukprot:SAG22_NODE_1115_length_5527_cov_2.365328_4_plen_726_part_01
MLAIAERFGECLEGGLVVVGRDGSGGGAGLEFSVKPQPLKYNTTYVLSLPTGTVVSNVSGPTTRELTVAPLHGLRPFVFPFLQPVNVKLDAPQVSLFVRHGLPEEATALAIQSALVLTEHKQSVPSTVHRAHSDIRNAASKTELRLAATFLPSGTAESAKSTNYTFASVPLSGLKDAFGLVVEPAVATFSTATLSTFEVQPDAFAAYLPRDAKPIALVALARGEEPRAQAPDPNPDPDRPRGPACKGVKLRSQAFGASHAIEDVLMLAFLNCSNATAVESVFGRSANTFGPQPPNTELQQWKFGQLSTTGGISDGWVLAQNTIVAPEWQTNCSLPPEEQSTCSLYTAARFSVSTVATPDSVVVLITADADASPIEGAAVTLYRLYKAQEEQCCHARSKCPCSSVEKVAEISTDKDGAATFSGLVKGEDSSSVSFIAVARFLGEMQHGALTTVSPPEPVDPKEISVVGDIIIDRRLFSPSDPIHVAVFLRAYDSQGRDVPVPSFRPSWSLTSGHAVVTNPFVEGNKTMVIVDEFGIGSCVWSVPANATHGTYDVDVTSERESGFNGAAAITIADPRHPSAVLVVETDALVYRPQSRDGILLNITCQSYLGDLIKGAVVDISWTVGYPASTGDSVVILPSGRESVPFALPRHALRRAALLEQSLQITVTWLDATRDLLKKTLSIPVELSSWHIGVTTNPPAPRIFAGFPFRATGRVTVPSSVQIGTKP